MSVPVLFRQYRHLCSEAAARDAMSDAEFWEHVLGTGTHYEDDVADYYDGPIDNAEEIATACPECGAWGACGYDAEGRPMIHTLDVDADS